MLTLCMLTLFLLTAAYFCYSVYFYGGRWVANPYNPRISSQKQNVIMGSVTDRDGTVLAYTDETGSRRYNSNEQTRLAVSQVVGDSGGNVSTGVDTFHAQYLLGFKASILERLADAFTDTPQRGDDVQLTISERLSRYISEQFPAGKRGAVVVLDYSTHEILAMVSMPQFDPEDLSSALEDEAAGALINRAIQGLYPPGSTFKIVTMASALSNLPDLDDFAFDWHGILSRGKLFGDGGQRARRADALRCVHSFLATRRLPRCLRIWAMRCWEKPPSGWDLTKISCSAISSCTIQAIRSMI